MSTKRPTSITWIVPRSCSRCCLLFERYKMGVAGLVTFTGTCTFVLSNPNGALRHAASHTNIWNDFFYNNDCLQYSRSYILCNNKAHHPLLHHRQKTWTNTSCHSEITNFRTPSLPPQFFPDLHFSPDYIFSSKFDVDLPTRVEGVLFLPDDCYSHKRSLTLPLLDL